MGGLRQSELVLKFSVQEEKETDMITKKFIIYTLACIFFPQLYSAPSMLGQIHLLDTNNDKEISLEEFNEESLNRFKNYDADNDGLITQEEFLSALSKRFKNIDTNSDGS